MGDQHEGAEEGGENAGKAEVGIEWGGGGVEEVGGRDDEELLRVGRFESGEEAQNSKIESGFLHILLINKLVIDQIAIINF